VYGSVLFLACIFANFFADFFGPAFLSTYAIQKTRYFEYSVQSLFLGGGGRSVKVFLSTACCCQKYIALQMKYFWHPFY